MNYREVISELERMGTAQNVKVYKRHGAGDNVYGVSFANLNKLQKKIGRDQELAESLWDSGNVDARSLALMIADPDILSEATVERWVRDNEYYVIADLLASLVAKTGFAEKKFDRWSKAKAEYVRQAGYSLLASLLKDGHELSDSKCRAALERIEEQIQRSPNRAKHAMNMALIAIGTYRPELSEEAKNVSLRIGKVEVDHGETSCKTPDAVSYIDKALKRRSRKSA
jgi:3-methyladenine DNA glycosylase AlkD